MRIFLTAAALGLAISQAACAKQAIILHPAPGVNVSSITVTSPSIPEGGRVPVDCTCDGTEVMPELVVSAPPEGTKSLVFIVDDPDAENGDFYHMVIFNAAPDTHKLVSGTDIQGAGDTARFGLNDFKVARYSGPCPPRGEAHRYRWRVLALDTMLKLPEGTPRSQLDENIDGHIIGEGSLNAQFGH